MRRVSLGFALLAVIAIVLMQGSSLDAQAPTLPDFYNPPVPLPPGEPGELIRVELLTAPLGVKAWRILYHSRDYDGKDTAVSGMVAAPDAPPPAGGFPVLTVGHGTTGVARSCAPSIDPLTTGGNADDPGFFKVLVPFIQAGFIVAATDYQGLGAPGLPSYLIGKVEAHNVLDAARAARRLPDLPFADPTVIWGHSQGGHAAAWAAILAPDYAPELAIFGVAMAAPAAELGIMVSAVESVRSPTDATSFFVMGAYAISQTLPGLTLSEILTPAGLATVPVVTTACGAATYTPYQSQPPAAFIDGHAGGTPPWSTAITEQVPSGIPVTTPVIIVQGLADTTVPPITTQIFATNLCKEGDTVELKTYAGANHSGVLAPSTPDVIAWFNARLAGAPAPSTCGG